MCNTPSELLYEFRLSHLFSTKQGVEITLIGLNSNLPHNSPTDSLVPCNKHKICKRRSLLAMALSRIMACAEFFSISFKFIVWLPTTYYANCFWAISIYGILLGYDNRYQFINKLTHSNNLLKSASHTFFTAGC